MPEMQPSPDHRNEPGLQSYLQTIAKHRSLTNAEEAELLRDIRAGAREPFDWLIDANLRRVVGIAREFLDHGLGWLDLIAEGNVGLIRAVRRFDGYRMPAFAPFAESLIRQTIQQAIGEST